MEAVRNNFVNIIIGTRGTGKTDFVKNLIIQLQSTFHKQLVVDTFDSLIWRNLKTWNQPSYESFVVPILPVEKLQYWKNGIYRTFSSDEDLIINAIEEHVFDCHVILEDATKYIGSKLTKKMKRFVLDTKQKNVDLTLVFHSLTDVPTDLIRISDTLTLFKTGDAFVPKKYKWWQLPIMLKKLNDSPNKHHNITIQLN